MQFEFYFAKTRAAAHYIHFLTKVYIFSAVIETALSVLYTPMITCRQSPLPGASQDRLRRCLPDGGLRLRLADRAAAQPNRQQLGSTTEAFLNLRGAPRITTNARALKRNANYANITITVPRSRCCDAEEAKSNQSRIGRYPA